MTTIAQVRAPEGLAVTRPNPLHFRAWLSLMTLARAHYAEAIIATDHRVRAWHHDHAAEYARRAREMEQ